MQDLRKRWLTIRNSFLYLYELVACFLTDTFHDKCHTEIEHCFHVSKLCDWSGQRLLQIVFHNKDTVLDTVIWYIFLEHWNVLISYVHQSLSFWCKYLDTGNKCISLYFQATMVKYHDPWSNVLKGPVLFCNPDRCHSDHK